MCGGPGGVVGGTHTGRRPQQGIIYTKYSELNYTAKRWRGLSNVMKRRLSGGRKPSLLAGSKRQSGGSEEAGGQTSSPE